MGYAVVAKPQSPPRHRGPQPPTQPPAANHPCNPDSFAAVRYPPQSGTLCRRWLRRAAASRKKRGESGMPPPYGGKTFAAGGFGGFFNKTLTRGRLRSRGSVLCDGFWLCVSRSLASAVPSVRCTLQTIPNNPTAGSRAVRLSVYCAPVPSVAFPTLQTFKKRQRACRLQPFRVRAFLVGKLGLLRKKILRRCVRCPSGGSARFFFARGAFFFRFFLRGVSFFLIFVAGFQFFLWLLLLSHRLLPWWLLSAFPSCGLRSLASWSASPRAPAPLLRCGSRRRVRPSRVRWSVGVFALGGLLGRSRCWSLGRGAWWWVPVVSSSAPVLVGVFVSFF